MSRCGTSTPPFGARVRLRLRRAPEALGCAIITDTPRIPTIRLHAGRQKRVQHGHPWVYSNEVQMDQPAKAVPPGSAVRLVDAGGTPLGIATFNPHTLIAARMLSADPATVVDHAFLAGRLKRAVELRETLFDRPYYRVVHAEADGLPGLIVDRYGDVVTVQANSVFMDQRIDQILEALDEVMAPRAVILRNDSTQRALEGLPEETRLAKGELDGPLRLEENGNAFFADPLGGQKTGWFYDQRDNRAYIASLAKGARVIDFFSYNGGFAVTCATRGAASVVAVDRSQPALDNAARAAEANGVAGIFEARRAEASSHRCVYRPWGHYRTLQMGERYQVKCITVRPGGLLSLQKHYHRAEHWVVVNGTALVTRDSEELLLRENESCSIRLGAVHRLHNPGKVPLNLIEVQSGAYLGEDDIVRFEDTYGRS